MSIHWEAEAVVSIWDQELIHASICERMLWQFLLQHWILHSCICFWQRCNILLSSSPLTAVAVPSWVWRECCSNISSLIVCSGCLHSVCRDDWRKLKGGGGRACGLLWACEHIYIYHSYQIQWAKFTKENYGPHRIIESAEKIRAQECISIQKCQFEKNIFQILVGPAAVWTSRQRDWMQSDMITKAFFLLLVLYVFKQRVNIWCASAFGFRLTLTHQSPFKTGHDDNLAWDSLILQFWMPLAWFQGDSLVWKLNWNKNQWKFNFCIKTISNGFQTC